MAEPIYRNRDYSLTVSGAQNSVTGSYLNSAVGTWTLYDSAGASVATGSLTYTASSDGVYTGVIENATTATLTVGGRYSVLLTLAESGVDWRDQFTVPAQDPGEVIIDAEIWQDYSGNSVTGGDLVSASRWSASVRKALLKMLRPYVPEPQSATFYLDAPPKNALILPVCPIRSLTSVHLHPGAYGDSSLFVAADALTAATDYYSPTDPLDGLNRTGFLYRTHGAIWGYSTRREPGRLAPTLDVNRGAIKIVANIGEPTVPEDVRAAAVAAVSLLMERRKTGAPRQSESWGGYSTSYAGPFTAEAALRSPEVMGFIAHYLEVRVA